MFLTLTIIHVIIAIILIVVVLMQHGKQQGLSGAIAGGAETFFGKNKGRTIDAMLKKFTAVIAILFVVSSLMLTAVAVKDANDAAKEAEKIGIARNRSVTYENDEHGIALNYETVGSAVKKMAKSRNCSAELDDDWANEIAEYHKQQSGE